MAYATLQNLIDRYGEATILAVADRDRDGVADAAVVAGALADASDTIDSYVVVRYRLPFATPPPILTRQACTLAFAALHGDMPTEGAKTDAEKAIAWLKDIAAGRAQLVGVDAAEPAAETNQVLHVAPGRIFTSDSLRGA